MIVWLFCFSPIVRGIQRAGVQSGPLATSRVQPGRPWCHQTLPVPAAVTPAAGGRWAVTGQVLEPPGAGAGVGRPVAPAGRPSARPIRPGAALL